MGTMISSPVQLIVLLLSFASFRDKRALVHINTLDIPYEFCTTNFFVRGSSWSGAGTATMMSSVCMTKWDKQRDCYGICR